MGKRAPGRMEYLTFHMHKAHLDALCRRLELPRLSLSHDTPDEAMFELIYDVERMLSSDDAQVRRMSEERFFRTRPGLDDRLFA